MRRYFMTALIVALAACDHATVLDTGVTPGKEPEPGLKYVGSFHPVVHSGAGTADVYLLEGGGRELRFEDDFATVDGPKLEVWLVSADDAQDSRTVADADHISLGKLESPTGAQSYSIPDGASLTNYKSVVVWCVALRINFTTAPLMRR